MRFLVLLLVLLIQCDSNPANLVDTGSSALDELMIEDLRIFIQENYSDLELITSPFNRIVDYYPEQFSEGVDTGYDFLFAYDLNNDSYLDYMFRLFSQRDLENNDRYDSVVEVYTELLFGNEKDFVRVDDGFGYHGFVFNGIFSDDNYSPSTIRGIISAGEYTDLHNRAFTVTKPSLGTLGPFSYGVTEWFNPDSSVTHIFWSD